MAGKQRPERHGVDEQRAPRDSCRHPLVRHPERQGVTDVVGVPWGSDASKFARQSDWHALVLGPGSVEQAHTANEWVEIDELVMASDLYVETALQFAEKI